MSFSHYLWSTLMSMPTTAHHKNPSSSSNRISKLAVRRRSPIPNAAGKMLLLSFCCFCLLVATMASPCTASPAEMAAAAEDQQPLGVDEADFDLEAKRCQAAYECWPTEPVLADGRPLFMASIVKRLNIGSGFQTRGAKCRCREGQCTFYSVPKRRFFNCQEL